MSIIQFTVAFSRTLSLRPYESARVEASITCACETADYAETAANAQLELQQLLRETYEKQKDVIK